MGKIDKTFALFLTLTIALSCMTLLTVKPVSAQSIRKPSVPEFTLKYLDNSYDIPAEYGIDQFTGQTIVIKSGQHIDNRSVEITIKNQPFNNFTDVSSGRTINLFYNIRYKGTFTENWTEIYGGKGKMIMYSMDVFIAEHGYPKQADDSQFTTILFPVSNIPNNVQLHFQIEALEGYTDRFIQDSRILFLIVDYEFTGQEIGWSNTQTITIGNVSNTNTPNPTTSYPTITSTPTSTSSTPDTNSDSTNFITLPLNSFIAIIVVTAAVVSIVVALLALSFRRHRAKINSQASSS